ncbi:MAG: hypothetical protein K0S33_1878 [Bacteroidetes bacterium]|nr:hypothetical protein [Bacteroidota bacterium]
MKNNDEALALFERATLAHEKAIEEGNHKVANKNHDQIMEAISFLKGSGEVDLLRIFLDHSSDGVKGWAATYLLPIREEEAIHVLENISQGTGTRAFAAGMALSEWRKGNLKL